jgi:hypothetical protein
MRDLILSDLPYSNPEYLPMVIMTYHEVYGIYPNISDAILAPFDTLLPIWTSGIYTNGWVGNQMEMMGANPPKAIVIPEVLDTFSVDSTHIMRVLLKENDVYRWVPQAPVRFLYCSADEQVSYLNSLKAYEYMTAAGAQNLSIQNVDSVLDHFNCAQFAILDMRSFFEPMRHDKIQLFLDQYQAASGPGSADGSVTLDIVGGAPPLTVEWSNGQTGLTASGLSPGTYTATATGADGCSAQISVIVNFSLSNGASVNTPLPALYPNPAEDFIRAENLTGTYRIQNLSGQTVLAGELFSESALIPLSQLTSGAYLFSCGSFRQLIIKN